MSKPVSNRFVFFGATGDLANKQIFPALQSMIRRGHFDVQIIGVARSALSKDEFCARARKSLEEHGGVHEPSFETLCKNLTYLSGNYTDEKTYTDLCGLLGSDARPLYYLAIPPNMFVPVVQHLAQSGCAKDARVIVEKPFGRDLCPKNRSFASTTTSARNRSRTFSIFASPIPFWSRSGTATSSRACKSRWPNASVWKAAASSMRMSARFVT
jgi:glucose-6-phosphate 1-dehydrogenase